MGNKRLGVMVALVLLSVVAIVGVTPGLAAQPVKLLVNGQAVPSDVPSQLVSGRVLVPVRWVAEALGAEVRWDEEGRTVEVETGAAQGHNQQVELLERALLPDSPADVAAAWAQAVKTRNGAYQYALLVPELKRIYRGELEGNGWVTGASSPWVEATKVVEERAEGNTKVYNIQYQLQTATGTAGRETQQITVSEVAGRWYVTGAFSSPQQGQQERQLAKQVEQLLEQEFQHYRILDKEVSLEWVYISGSVGEAVYNTKVQHVMDIAGPEEWPIHQGKLKFLAEKGSSLSPAARGAVEADIAFWDRELRGLYIGQPSEGYSFLRVRGQFDQQGAIRPETVEIMVEDPLGNWLPVDLGQVVVSREELVQQGYQQMVDLVESLQ